jgi:hypothetical protein
MATLSELINETLNKETPGIIIPAGTEDQVGAADIGVLQGNQLPKLKIWFITEQLTATTQITSNPTVNGRVQNDNIILDPTSWNIRAKVTDVMGQLSTADVSSLAGAFASSLAPGADRFFQRAGAGVSNSVQRYLMQLRDTRQPFTIVTSFGRAGNLFFDNLVFDRDKDSANSLPIQMSLKELFIPQSVTLEAVGEIQPSQGFTSIAQQSQNLGQQQGVQL